MLTQPGLPDDVRPVTIRPYVSSVRLTIPVQTGIRVRPASAPGRTHNFTPNVVHNVTNAPVSALPFSLVARPAPERVSMILASQHSPVGAYFDTATAAEPLEPPLGSMQIPPSGDLTFEIGLRVNPDDVLFPEQTPTGPDDPRLPFGVALPLQSLFTSNTSFEKAAFTTQQGLRNASVAFAPLEQYLDAVDGVNAGAVTGAVESVLRLSSRAINVSDGLLRDILGELDPLMPTPAGLAAMAAPVFRDSLDTAVYDLTQREGDATRDALTASSAAIAALLQGELDALGIVYDLGPTARPTENRRTATVSGPEAPPPGPGGAYSGTSTTGTNTTIQPTGPFGGYFSGAPVGKENPTENQYTAPTPPSGPADPNDKYGDTSLPCLFGTVMVGGEDQTACVRYFLPLASAAEPVEYTVRFENIATAGAPAEFVTITDVLDPAFNPATLEVLGTSSDSTFSYSASGQTVTFRFIGIDLPPNTTPPNGEGYVHFRVRPAAALADGATLSNTASIVFDFNPAIATRTVVHEVRQVADLAVEVRAPGSAAVGQPAAFRVFAANLRGDAASATSLTIMPPAATVLSVTPSAGTCSGTAPIVCDLSDLASGENGGAIVSVDVVVQPTAAGTLTLAASASTTAFDALPANNAGSASVTAGVVASEADPAFPRELTLSSPRPNPARGATTLRWGLPTAASVDIRVYDLLGREVARLADGEAQEAGWHEARWDAQVASGVYVVRVRVGDDVRTRRMTVIR